MPVPEVSIVNIAAYRFVKLDRLEEHREWFRRRCSQLALKGTVLLSSEGINLFLAGSGDAIDKLLESLNDIDPFAGLDVKRSDSDRVPFRRMVVKVKPEIIPFGVAGIDHEESPAPGIAPRQLKAWLDAGPEITLLDVRNDFEIEYGTFTDACPVGVGHFRQFPEAWRQLRVELDDRPVVMFCTGGIRCEKAAPYLQQRGFKNVYRLDGGILRYFQECGDAHYQGDCFVFDERVAVDSQLRPKSEGPGVC